MNTANLYPGRFLRAADLTGPETLTVAKVEMTSLNGAQKLLLYFEERTQPLVLNATNWRSIVALAGSQDSDDWIGQRVALQAVRVTFQGTLVDALRLAAPPARSGKAQPRRVVPADPDRDDVPDGDVPF